MHREGACPTYWGTFRIPRFFFPWFVGNGSHSLGRLPYFEWQLLTAIFNFSSLYILIKIFPHVLVVLVTICIEHSHVYGSRNILEEEWKDRKSQGIREYAVKLCLLATFNTTFVNFHHYNSPNMSLTRMIPIDRTNWTKIKKTHKALTLHKEL